MTTRRFCRARNDDGLDERESSVGPRKSGGIFKQLWSLRTKLMRRHPLHIRSIESHVVHEVLHILLPLVCFSAMILLSWSCARTGPIGDNLRPKVSKIYGSECSTEMRSYIRHDAGNSKWYAALPMRSRILNSPGILYPYAVEARLYHPYCRIW